MAFLIEEVRNRPIEWQIDAASGVTGQDEGIRQLERHAPLRAVGDERYTILDGGHEIRVDGLVIAAAGLYDVDLDRRVRESGERIWIVAHELEQVRVRFGHRQHAVRQQRRASHVSDATVSGATGSDAAVSDSTASDSTAASSVSMS